ncbi:hypothetical protein QE152_g8975 [Popillia japonica]|uniref:Uncharacterized protein n=1 Tax=Popillia japonica TaxID=7064 RepID=A0AAW1LWB2_POPJA
MNFLVDQIWNKISRLVEANYQWCMLNEDTPPTPMFPSVAKPKIHFPKEDDLHYFNLFLSDEVIEMTTLETNRYAQQSLHGRPSTSSST